MDTTDELDLRVWLAKQLKKPDVPNPLWDTLVDEEYVEEALGDFSFGRDDLLEKAREKIRHACELADEWRGGGPLIELGGEQVSGPVGGPLSIDSALTDYEEIRAQAFEEYLAKLAEGLPVVQNFRRRILGLDSGTPTPEQARDLATSPALRFLSPSWFLTRDAPVLGSEVQIVGQEHRPWTEVPDFAHLIVHVELPDGRKELERILIKAGQQPDILVLPYGKGLETREVAVWPHSILGILRNVGSALAQGFTWEEDAAAWFVLTGELPSAPPLRASSERYGEDYFQHWTISMTAAPWISADTISRFYREFQRAHLGRNNRPLSERNVAVFRFVIGQLHPRYERMDAPQSMQGGSRSMISKRMTSLLTGPSWRALLDLWNRTYPEWRYKDVRLFHRDFDRAHRSISGSNYPNYLH